MKISGPHTGPLKTFLDYRKSPLEYFNSKFQAHGDLVRFNMMGKNVFLVSNPQIVDHVLAKNASSYIKGRTTQKLKKIIGNGLITNEGQTWKTNNRLIRKSFSVDSVRSMAPIFHEHTDKMLSRWESKTNNEIDILREIHQLSLGIISESLFNQQMADENFFEDSQFLMDYMVSLTRSINPYLEYLPTRKNRRFKKTMKRFDRALEDLVTKRMKELEEGTPPDDLLSLLLTKETYEKLGKQQIKDEIITLLMAGHETITNALSWAFILLSKHPDIVEELRQDADKIFSQGDDSVLEKNILSRQVLNESMRLYPPVWVFMRENIQEDEYFGERIPKGSMIILAPYFTHRHQDLWEDPEKFWPERFDSLNANKGIKGVRFFPFGHGPRICLGNHLAYLEGQIILLKILQRYELSPIEEASQEMDPGITLRPLNNRRFRITQREV